MRGQSLFGNGMGTGQWVVSCASLVFLGFYSLPHFPSVSSHPSSLPLFITTIAIVITNFISIINWFYLEFYLLPFLSWGGRKEVRKWLHGAKPWQPDWVKFSTTWSIERCFCSQKGRWMRQCLKFHSSQNYSLILWFWFSASLLLQCHRTFSYFGFFRQQDTTPQTHLLSDMQFLEMQNTQIWDWEFFLSDYLWKQKSFWKQNQSLFSLKTSIP